MRIHYVKSGNLFLQVSLLDSGSWKFK